jgi:hypothetical protein
LSRKLTAFCAEEDVEVLEAMEDDDVAALRRVMMTRPGGGHMRVPLRKVPGYAWRRGWVSGATLVAAPLRLLERMKVQVELRNRLGGRGVRGLWRRPVELVVEDSTLLEVAIAWGSREVVRYLLTGWNVVPRVEELVVAVAEGDAWIAQTLAQRMRLEEEEARVVVEVAVKAMRPELMRWVIERVSLPREALKSAARLAIETQSLGCLAALLEVLGCVPRRLLRAMWSSGLTPVVESVTPARGEWVRAWSNCQGCGPGRRVLLGVRPAGLAADVLDAAAAVGAGHDSGEVVGAALLSRVARGETELRDREDWLSASLGNYWTEGTKAPKACRQWLKFCGGRDWARGRRLFEDAGVGSWVGAEALGAARAKVWWDRLKALPAGDRLAAMPKVDQSEHGGMLDADFQELLAGDLSAYCDGFAGRCQVWAELLASGV